MKWVDKPNHHIASSATQIHHRQACMEASGMKNRHEYLNGHAIFSHLEPIDKRGFQLTQKHHSPHHDQGTALCEWVHSHNFSTQWLMELLTRTRRDQNQNHCDKLLSSRHTQCEILWHFWCHHETHTLAESHALLFLYQDPTHCSLDNALQWQHGGQKNAPLENPYAYGSEHPKQLYHFFQQPHQLTY